MKKLFTLIALMAITLTVQAQHEEGEFTIQPRVGMTVSNLTDGDKWKANFTAGVDFEHFFTDQFSLGVGVLFTNQGCIYNSVNEQTKAEEDLKFDIYYGAIPIMANVYVLPGLALKAGLQPAFRMKAKAKQGGTSIDIDKALMLLADESTKMNKFDLSIPVGLSYEISGITLDVRYNIGLTNLISGAEPARNSVFVFTLGYKFSR